MNYILTHRSLAVSAQILARQLDMQICTSPVLGLPPAVRWGNSLGNYANDTEYNAPAWISLSRRDLLPARLMSAGVACIRYHSGVETPEHFPVAMRTVVAGSKGEGLSIAENLQEFNAVSPAIWSYWEPFAFELGVHMLGGIAVKVMKKVWIGEGEESQYPIKNQEKGYHFKLVKVENFPKLPAFISRLYAAFPVQMARLDIGWSHEKNSYCVIECNTAPSLSSNEDTATRYIEFLRSKLVQTG